MKYLLPNFEIGPIPFCHFFLNFFGPKLPKITRNCVSDAEISLTFCHRKITFFQQDQRRTSLKLLEILIFIIGDASSVFVETFCLRQTRFFTEKKVP